MKSSRERRVALLNIKLPRYAGKALKAGDAFSATVRDAKVLTTAKLAEYDTRDQARQPKVERKAPTPPKAPVAPLPSPPASDLASLRATYKELSGKPAHNFWKADKLKAEIEALRAAAATPDSEADPTA